MSIEEHNFSDNGLGDASIDAEGDISITTYQEDEQIYFTYEDVLAMALHFEIITEGEIK